MVGFGIGGALLAAVARAVVVGLLFVLASSPAFTQQATRPPTAQAVPANPALQIARRVTVPDLAGLTCAQAQQRAGATLNCEPGAITGRVEPGRVQRQEPVAGTPITYTRAMPALRVWLEAPSVSVPALDDQSVAQVRRRLREVGLQARLVPDNAGPWHRARSQEPRAGARVAPQSVVTVQMVASYTVPSLLGDDCTAARERAAGAGLPDLACAEEDAPPDATAGRVQRQQPAAGTVLTAPQRLQAWVARPRSRVPDLVGQPEAAALSAARQARLQPEANGPAAAAGRVVARQLPAAGSVVAPQSPLRLTLALTVPMLQGLRCEAAQARAAEHGLATLRCETRPARAGEPWHTVAAQQPIAGTALAAPEPLLAEVALPATVPDLRGLALPEARARLQAAGLTAGVALRDGDDPADHEVASQRPAARTEVTPGSAVALTTVRYVRVPDLAGQSLDEAGAALKQAGLAARPDAADPARRVVRGQQPAAGARVRAGSAVALTSVRRVTVPALAGASCDEARARAIEAGLAFARCELDSALPWVLGTPQVTRQSIDGGQEADEGTPITAVAVPPPWSAPTLVGGLLATLAAVAKAGLVLLAPVKVKLLPSWRVRPDLTPRVTLRLQADDDDDDDPAAPRVAPRWRVERAPPRVWLRWRAEDGDQPGGPDDESRR